MNILIAEDDKASRKLLRLLIEKLPDYRIIGEASNGEELIEATITAKPDLALVDINMPLLNGMEAIKSCMGFHPSLQVIFITGYDNFALEAFSVRAIDYILKPIDKIRLYSALERAKKYIHLEREKNKFIRKDLLIKQQNTTLFIPFTSIVFIERLNRKSVVHTFTKQYETYESLSHLEKMLDSRFLLSHRSYIINTDHLAMIETVGQTFKAQFHNYQKWAKVSKSKFNEIQQNMSIM